MLTEITKKNYERRTCRAFVWLPGRGLRITAGCHGHKHFYYASICPFKSERDWSVRFSRCKKEKKNWVKNFVHFKPPRLIHQTYSCWPEKPIPVACGVNFTKPEINLSYASAEIPQQWNQMQLKNSKTINCVIILRWQTTKGGKRRWKIVKIFWGFRLWKIVS